MRISVLIFFSLLTLHSWSQSFNQKTWEERERKLDKLAGYVFGIETGLPNWDEIEEHIDFERKKEILVNLGRQDYYNNQLDGDNKEWYASTYHFVDLDKDGDNDIIYNSAAGADGASLMIWLKKDSGYNRIINQPGELAHVEFNSDNTILILKAYQFRKPYGIIFKYEIKVSGTTRPISKLLYPYEMKLPEKISVITKFENIHENYNLRSKPEVKDKPCELDEFSGFTFCGTKFLELKNGTLGTALSLETDETGRIWWFSSVRIDSKTTAVGWLSSRYVKKLDKTKPNNR